MPRKELDITGEKFNKLTALKSCGNKNWLFECECGNTITTQKGNVVKGNSKSCGCLRTKDITGKKYNKLTAVRFHHSKSGRPFWIFNCDCGNECISNRYNVVAGSAKSCGCLRKGCNLSGKDHPQYKHGDADMKNNGFYRRYNSILQRCYNRSCKVYKYYGKRGIRNLWKNYEEFKKDMYSGFIRHKKKYGSRQTTLERIDVNGNYCKENCKWATCKEQGNNKTDTKFIKRNGQKKRLVDVCREENIEDTHANRLRITSGWTRDEIFNNKKIIKIGKRSYQESNNLELKKLIMKKFKTSAETVKAYLSILSAREKDVLEQRLGLDNGERKTLDEVGEKYGVTRERIRQIEAKALDKIANIESA